VIVLDASAILAYLKGEPGWQQVEAVILDETAAVSTVNLTEVISKLIDHGMSESDAVGAVDVLSLHVFPFERQESVEAAGFRSCTRALDLSLGDRACLAAARVRGLPVLTADRPWVTLIELLQLDIRCVRPFT
jgi:PIN domain nuclease of toxin-antitoxin system